MRTLLLILMSASLAMAEIIPSSNRVDWVHGSTVGVRGGIPYRTNIFTNFTSSATAAEINNAITACPSNQVIQLAAGTYTISATISIGVKDGITIRGAGTNTVLKLTHDGTGIDWGAYGDTTPSQAYTTISSGFTKGSSNLTVASTAGFSVGDMAEISQKFDTNFMWNKGSQALRLVNQYVTIDAINGSVLTIWPPAYYGAITDGDARIGVFNGGRSEMTGIENLTLDGTGRTTVWGVNMIQCNNCWMTNVQTIKINNYHVYVYRAAFLEFATVHCNQSPVQEPNHGGIVLGAADDWGEAVSASIIYDGTFDRLLPGIEVNGGSSGNVVAYNYIRDTTYAGQAQSVGLLINHFAHNMFNLYEGNIVNMIQSDGYFGSESHATIFRNWSTGWTETFTNFNSKPIDFARYSRHMQIVGNVFGVTNFTPDYYIYTNNQEGYEISAIMHLGYPNAANSSFTGYNPPGGDPTNNYDLLVQQTARIHNNWDSKGLAIRYDAGIADHSPADSMYLTSKPGWFGNLTWPPFNPTVGYTNLHWDDIPAGYRYLYGTNPPAAAGGGHVTYNHTPRSRLRGIKLQR